MSQTKAQLIDNLVQPITGAAGSASAPTFSFTADPNTGLYSPGADQLALSTGGTGRLTIDSSGNINIDSGTVYVDAANNRLGVGTTSPGKSLEITPASNQDGISIKNTGAVFGALDFDSNRTGANQVLGDLRFLWNGTAVARIIGESGSDTTNKDDGHLTFYTASAGTPTERARIDSSGRLLVGTSTGNSLFNGGTQNPRFQIEGTTGDTILSSLTANRNDAAGPTFYLAHSRGTAAGGTTVLQSGDQCGIIAFAGTDGTDYVTAASITANVDGTPGADDMPGRLVFSTTADGASSPTERMRIDSSGRLLVGTVSARSNFFNTTVAAQQQLEGTTLAGSISSIVRTDASAGPGYLALAKSRGASIGTNAIVQNADALGGITFQGNDGTEFVEAARITAEVDGTPGANDMPGRLVFSTTADGASSPTERMRIGNDGATYFGVTGAPSGSIGGSAFLAESDSRRTLYMASTTTGGTTLQVFRNPNGQIGSITTSGSATAFNTSSDYRLKENVIPVNDGITRLQQLKPSRFNFIADPDKTVDGFIAHEVQAVVPEAITGEKDAVDKDGDPVYQGIDQSKLVPLLTAALQELVAEVESLKAEVAALKAQ